MRIGITYGTFDTLHYGHIRLLQRAKEQCDYLIVGLSTDEFNKLKGKESYFNYKERFELLESIKYIDEIIPEENWEQKMTDIKKYNVDVLFVGDDWTGKFDYLPCETIYLKRTELISSSIIKEAMNKNV